MSKSPDAFRTISEAAAELDLPQHVLRFWETRFSHIKPLKRGGGRRYYRPEDVDLLQGVRHLLYSEGYTIKGVQRILKEQGVQAVIASVNGESIRLSTDDDRVEGSGFGRAGFRRVRARNGRQGEAAGRIDRIAGMQTVARSGTPVGRVRPLPEVCRVRLAPAGRAVYFTPQSEYGAVR